MARMDHPPTPMQLMKHCTLKLAHARQKEVIRRLTQQLKAEVSVNNAMSKLVFRREDQNPPTWECSAKPPATNRNYWSAPRLSASAKPHSHPLPHETTNSTTRQVPPSKARPITNTSCASPPSLSCIRHGKRSSPSHYGDKNAVTGEELAGSLSSAAEEIAEERATKGRGVSHHRHTRPSRRPGGSRHHDLHRHPHGTTTLRCAAVLQNIPTLHHPNRP